MLHPGHYSASVLEGLQCCVTSTLVKSKKVELLYTQTLRHATCRLNYAEVPSRPKTSTDLEGKESSKVIWCALKMIASTVYNNVIHIHVVLSTFISALL